MKNFYRITLVVLLSQVLVFGAACNEAKNASSSSAQSAVGKKQENASAEPVSAEQVDKNEPISAEQLDKKRRKELHMEQMRKRIRERWARQNKLKK